MSSPRKNVSYCFLNCVDLAPLVLLKVCPGGSAVNVLRWTLLPRQIEILKIINESRRVVDPVLAKINRIRGSEPRTNDSFE